MAVPRNRLSNSRKNMKRSHHAKKPKNPSGCPSCGAPRLPHHICGSCGSYKGRTLIKKEEEKS